MRMFGNWKFSRIRAKIDRKIMISIQDQQFLLKESLLFMDSSFMGVARPRTLNREEEVLLSNIKYLNSKKARLYFQVLLESVKLQLNFGQMNSEKHLQFILKLYDLGWDKFNFEVSSLLFEYCQTIPHYYETLSKETLGIILRLFRYSKRFDDKFGKKLVEFAALVLPLSRFDGYRYNYLDDILTYIVDKNCPKDLVGFAVRILGFKSELFSFLRNESLYEVMDSYCRSNPHEFADLIGDMCHLQINHSNNANVLDYIGLAHSHGIYDESKMLCLYCRMLANCNYIIKPKIKTSYGNIYESYNRELVDRLISLELVRAESEVYSWGEKDYLWEVPRWDSYSEPITIWSATKSKIDEFMKDC